MTGRVRSAGDRHVVRPGAWIHYTVNVAPGGSVSIVAARIAGANAVISGVFLGPAGPPASGGPSPTPTPTPAPSSSNSPTPTPTASPTGPPPPVEQPGKQGDWVGSYGSVGYVLAGWNGSTDLAALPSASLSLLQGNRYLYGLSTEARAIREPIRVRATTHCFLGRCPDPPETRLPKRLHWTAGHLHG